MVAIDFSVDDDSEKPRTASRRLCSESRRVSVLPSPAAENQSTSRTPTRSSFASGGRPSWSLLPDWPAVARDCTATRCCILQVRQFRLFSPVFAPRKQHTWVHIPLAIWHCWSGGREGHLACRKSCTGNLSRAGSNPGLDTIKCNPMQVVNTHVPLSPSSIIWYQPMSCGWEGNCRSGVALATRHRH